MSSFPGTNLGKVRSVFTRDTPSRADHSCPTSTFPSISPFSSIFSFQHSFESRNRQTTAQSSTFEVGYLLLHDRTADSTRLRAAYARDPHDSTISTTSLFDSTSHICRAWILLLYYQHYIYNIYYKLHIYIYIPHPSLEQ